MKQLKVLTATIASLLLAVMVPGCSGEKSDAIVRTVVSERLIAQIDTSYLLSLRTTSPDARRVAYIDERDGKKFWVVDGIAGKPYDSIWAGRRLFSPDSKRVAYEAIAYGEKPPEGNRHFFVIDGEEGEGYDLHLMGPVFSPDSKHVAYWAGHVYIDRVEWKGTGNVVPSSLIFSPDSQHLAYIAKLGGKQFVAVDGVPGEQYDKIVSWSPVFSPDSQHLAYTAELGGKQFVVVDGVPGEQYDKIDHYGPFFSPDSNHLAYVAQEGYGSPDFRNFVVLDGIEGKRYKWLVIYGHNLVFSPDSNHLVYIAANEEMFLIVDGVEKEVPHGSISNLTFSPNSERLAYIVTVPTLITRLTGGFAGSYKSYIFVDGKKGKTYDSANNIHFSPDSKHIVYFAHLGRKSFVIVDGTSGKKFDSFYYGVGIYKAFRGAEMIAFDSLERFHYLARKGDSIYLVEETLKEEVVVDEEEVDEEEVVEEEVVEEEVVEEEVVAPAPETVAFPDKKLGAAIWDALGKPSGENITTVELAWLTALDASARRISDLSGIEYCINLTVLNLGDNQISDISPLASLNSLRTLSLNHNQINDISPLASLNNLTELRLMSNQIGNNLLPLSSLTKLTTLWLDTNQISDISPLGSLTNLTYLNLDGNQIIDISPLGSLTNLTELRLRWNQISDISPLVENNGLGAGDEVWLQDNNLDLLRGSADMEDIGALEDRGVVVHRY